MDVTYLVAVSISDVSQLTATAEQIEEDLSSSGHEVLSVHPWARPNVAATQPAGGFTSLTVPPPTIIS